MCGHAAAGEDGGIRRRRRTLRVAEVAGSRHHEGDIIFLMADPMRSVCA